MFKALIIGLGSAGQRHVRNFSKILGENIEFFSFRSRGRNQVITADLKVLEGATIESHYGIKSFTDLSEAMAVKPDFVVIASPNSMHLQTALIAAEAGCDLFIEKPISHTLDGVQKLKTIVENKKLICFVAYQMRFHPGFRLIQKALLSNQIGRIIAARFAFGEYLPGWHPYEDYREYHASRSDQGGGVIISQIHDMDLVYAIFGLPKKVFALGGHLSDLEVDVEDTASILMECERDGKIIPVHLHQDYLQKPTTRNFEIVGTKGKILWDYPKKTVHIYNVDRTEPEIHSFENFDRNQMFFDEAKHFMECIQSRQAPLVNVDDGINSLKMALMAKASLERGSIVEGKEFA